MATKKRTKERIKSVAQTGRPIADVVLSPGMAAAANVALHGQTGMPVKPVVCEEPPPPSSDIVASMPVWLAPPPETTYVTNHIDIELSQRQAETLWRVREGLADEGARLLQGRHVKSTADAVRYMIEQFAIEPTGG